MSFSSPDAHVLISGNSEYVLLSDERELKLHIKLKLPVDGPCDEGDYLELSGWSQCLQKV